MPSVHREVDPRFLPYFQKRYRYSARSPWFGGLWLGPLSCKYGPTFSDGGDILPLAIAIDALPYGWLSTSRWNSSPERILFCEWLSNFHHLMRRDLEKSNIDESHLFAIFHVFLAHRFKVTLDSKAIHTYAVLFAWIMQYLCSLFLSGREPISSFLSAVWPLMVSIVRLILCFRRKITVVQIGDNIINLWWDVHQLYEIVGPIDDCPFEDTTLRDYRFFYHCHGVEASLKTCLLVYLQPRQNGLNLTFERITEIHHSMQNLRMKLEKFRGREKAAWLMKVMVLKPLKLAY